MIASTQIRVPRTARHVAFTRFAWGTLAWNLLVVLWGAYVRASGSGAGCGNRWPLCNGEVAPSFPRLATAIEFAHRASSGVALIAVAGLFFWSIRDFPRGHRVRRAALWSLIFLVFEAFLGAGLVLFDYVDKNATAGRAAYLSLHLVNTELLLGALALTAWFAKQTGGSAADRGVGSKLVKASLAVTILISVSGVIAALGDTLFPASSLAEGLRQDASAAASFLVRLRVIHPVLAVAGACFVIYAAITVLRHGASPVGSRIGVFVIVTAVAQLCAGAMNIALLTPAWMQIVHLLIADVLWVLLVLLAVEASPKRPIAALAA